MTQPAIEELDYPVNGFGLNRAFPERYPYLLESTATGSSTNARFDILFAFPGETLRWDMLCKGQNDFLSQLNLQWQQASCGQSCPEHLPFAGGWFVYLGYEIAAEIEHRLKLPMPTTALPHAFASRIAVALINDHQLKKSYLVAEAGTDLPLTQVINDLQFVADETNAVLGSRSTIVVAKVVAEAVTVPNPIAPVELALRVVASAEVVVCCNVAVTPNTFKRPAGKS